MSEQTLCSVGIDIGTTTTQLVFSRLLLHNSASAWCVPELQIAETQVFYRAPVWRTPLLDRTTIDVQAVAELIHGAYQDAGILPQQVETGAVIITGETARKDNADEVLHAVSHLAGDFVVATAGPSLEGILAGKGAGCPKLSETGPVLNLDMGGGTTNMALFAEGQVVSTGCLNVGGHLLWFDRDHRLQYRSPVLDGFCALQVGQIVTESELYPVAQMLAQVLEQALGLREKTTLPHFITDEAISMPEAFPRLCFSGGVAACMKKELAWDAYGDLGVLLASAVSNSRLGKMPSVAAAETLRATVVGAGSHSTSLSGSTIFYQNVAFPMKNLPVMSLSPAQETAAPEQMRRILRQKQRVVGDLQAVLAFDGDSICHYAQLRTLASAIAEGWQYGNILVCSRADLAKALGQAISALAPDRPILCVDRLHLAEGMYLDVGRPVAGGQALPVVIKTLLWN